MQQGLSDENYNSVQHYHDHPDFTERERLAAEYAERFAIDTPAGRHTVRALFDAQELDSRQSTGTVYWEGLSDLFDSNGRHVGRGYLEMTGYAQRLRL